MNGTTRWALIVCLLTLTGVSAAQAGNENTFIGRWALTIPGGGAGWLGVEDKGGYLDAAILWGGGSVVPVDSVYIDHDRLYVTRNTRIERKDAAGKVLRTQTFTEIISAQIDGDNMELMQLRPNQNGRGASTNTFTGKRIPALPARPDLSKVKYGDPVQLFNGRDTQGWRLTNPGQTSGWSVENGVLSNRPVQQEGKPHISYGNLRTESEFEDFNLKLEVNVPKGGNSGIYLRGIYEVQVTDSYGRGLDSHHMGGIYSRITPSVSAEKPAGQWQDYDITLLDRHVTVKLNGKTIIDNQPLLGCTGGALWSDEFKPGPIYLQGDHTGVSYRNIVLTPIINADSIVFEDGFDGKLVAGWTWLREDRKTWRLRDNALEICVEPGVAHNVKNALVRPAPDRHKGKYAFDVTVSNLTVPTNQYEQAGLTWYNDGKAVFKLVKERVDGQLIIIPGRKPMTSQTVQLRLVVNGGSITAQYRANAEGDFQTAAAATLPEAGKDEISIQCYNGPADAEHWIRFDDFRITRLKE
ncbi:MAG: DUF1080 domain-containing protein [Sedimentisphaerales bacterium]|nr:DUF1080 domain-containing protein [Sedimentisphaerales bacterium]